MSSDTIDWRVVLGPLFDSMISAGELEPFEAAAFDHARRAVRLRPHTTPAKLPFSSLPVPWFDAGRFVAVDESNPAPRPGGFLQHASGDYYVQDAGSMLALALCQVVRGQWVCDTCAAPGGKSTALLELLAGDGLLLANEVISSRLGILDLALARCGDGNHLLTNLDVAQLLQLCGAAFDCVLVDAPCTGQSLVSRGKQSLAAFSRAQIQHSSARQTRILRAAAGLVKPLGRLVYSTCSYSYDENERVVSQFLEEHPGWSAASVAGLEPWQSPMHPGCYRVWPHRDHCAGAFAALLVRANPDVAASVSPLPSRRKAWQPLPGCPASIDWLTPIEPAAWWQCKHQLHRFHPLIPQEWIPSAESGVAFAEKKSSGWQPLFGSSQLPDRLVSHRRAITLNDQQAVRYVAGEAMRLDTLEQGWCIVKWRDRPLSWGKLASGSLKNHFPKLLRQTSPMGLGTRDATTE
jgi:16S rRNA C967 or C1407 C5-methylase (RsmB/RsmF family)/NOL1/NOP2/fmu family ribosome biogenesis protein